MKFPTLNDVNAADRLQICRWYRFLPSPGTSAIGTDEFETVLKAQGTIMDRIGERLNALGGFTPEISKTLGFQKPTDDIDDNYDRSDNWCEHCHGLGIINCHCGGDICVCAYNGEIDCPHCD